MLKDFKENLDFEPKNYYFWIYYQPAKSEK